MIPYADPSLPHPYANPFDVTEPRTVYWFKNPTPERWAAITGAQERRQMVGLAAGLKEHDPELRKAVQASHIEAFAELCVKIENAPGPEGPRTLTESGAIHQHHRELFNSQYAMLVNTVANGQILRDDEGKEYASPPTPAD